MGNQLIAEADIVEYPTKTLKMIFACSGLDGSHEAFLSYESLVNHGHIWFVDKTNHRDCKGQWMIDSNEEYSWEIICLDGYMASGTLTNPLNLSGSGIGKDSNNREVIFVFGPQKIQ